MFARDGQVDLVASISNDILPTSYSFINRAHPYKLSEDVLKNIPMYNWESVANRIRNSFGISGNRNLHIFKKWKRQPLIWLPFVVLRLYKIFIFNSFKEPTSSNSKYIRY